VQDARTGIRFPVVAAALPATKGCDHLEAKTFVAITSRDNAILTLSRPADISVQNAFGKSHCGRNLLAHIPYDRICSASQIVLGLASRG
jgi:hypothetical protein